jgi:hypothetical protein
MESLPLSQGKALQRTEALTLDKVNIFSLPDLVELIAS